jgi:hypothetical protein
LGEGARVGGATAEVGTSPGPPPPSPCNCATEASLSLAPLLDAPSCPVHPYSRPTGREAQPGPASEEEDRRMPSCSRTCYSTQIFTRRCDQVTGEASMSSFSRLFLMDN